MKLERHRPGSIGVFGSSGAQPIHLGGGKSSGICVCVYEISNIGLN